MGRALSVARARAPAFHVVLLAGGSGTRFWPMSRRARPKQFLVLGGGRSLLRQTWDRARRLAPAARIWLVAPKALATMVRRELPALRRSNLVLEPSPRDTGPAVTLACAAVARRDPNAIVAIFPTDHLVRDERSLAGAVRVARTAAARGSLVCLGVRPDYPGTGFGYLELAGRPRKDRATRVRRFVEKPDITRARRFLRTGRYLWNGGMFVWSVARYLDVVAEVGPRLHAAAVATASGDARAWTRAPRISVDYAVMEKAPDVAVVPLDAGWDDVGSWEAAARLGTARPAASRRDVRIDSEGSVVFGDGRLVALLGARDLVIVDTDEVLLVASRSAAEHVKSLVEAVRNAGREDLL